LPLIDASCDISGDLASFHAISATNHTSRADDDVQGRVRERLRALRIERGLTLADVAAAAGMDASTLSRLESGTRRLTLDHLPPLARALGVRADDLLTAPRAEDPRVRSTARSGDGMTIWPLNQHPDRSGQHAFKIRLTGRRRKPTLRTHEGHEWLYVLSGRLRLLLGDDDFVLHPGEAAEFSTWTPHWMGVVDEPAEVIAIFGPHGERVHLLADQGRTP
jgi:transcriptional regulator with XRE-family HTH domain